MTNSSPESPSARLRGARVTVLAAENIGSIHRILLETGAFTAEEVRMAVELLEQSLAVPEGDYQARVLSLDGEAIGYTCFGRAPFTDAVFDIYWIAVAPAWHGTGAARMLMDWTEREIRARGGRLMLVETASKASYARTRRFYESIGYREVARIRDYYRVGDDKIIYEKRG